MILRNFFNFINQFFVNISYQIKNIYLNSKYYDKKISKVGNNDLVYKPSPHLLSSLIKYQTKKININDISVDDLWDNKNFSLKDFKRLNNFYWFFSLDLKSSKKNIQKIILNWIKKNIKYNANSWEFDLTSKRIIAWLSSHNLTFNESDSDYQKKFNRLIKKQTNHLINEINRSNLLDNKIIGCAAIILVGLCYKNEKNYLEYGVNLLKKISKFSFDNNGFVKSRNIKQLVFYLKYFVLIREWFKESQNNVPEHIDETIYYLGQGYAFLCQNIKSDFLFNGNNIQNNDEFDHYLRKLGYKFKNENYELGGYTLLKDKKIFLILDSGSSPDFKFTKDVLTSSQVIPIASGRISTPALTI